MTRPPLRNPGRIPLVLLVLGCSTPLAAAAWTPPGKTAVSPSRHADAYILSRGHQFFSTNASLEDISALRKRLTDDFLWVRRAGKEVVIEDARIIEEARRLFDPLRQLDPDREALRRQQERLGSDEAALDREEEALDSELEAADEDGPRHGSATERSDLERRRIELKSKRRAFESREKELDSVENALEKRSDALEEKAERELWGLIDRAFANGLGRAVGPVLLPATDSSGSR